MVQNTAEVLEERGTKYGMFTNQATIAQSFHLIFEEGRRLSGKNRFSFEPDQLEAIGMIFNKIARIINGDPNYSDSWRDIAGYATLIADRLDNDILKIEHEANMKEQYERNRDPKQIEANRSDNVINEARGGSEQVQDTTTADANRPTGRTELRRLPVTLEVQDGTEQVTSETRPGVPGAPRQ